MDHTMLTFMTYNIKNAAVGRLDAIVAVIRAYRPDVLALQELGQLYRRPRRLLARIEAATGMRGHAARSLAGQAVAVLVRPPGMIMSTGRVRRPLHHAAALLSVDTCAGPISVMSAHLHATSTGRRLREARWLVGKRPPRLTVLMGDLNTLDPGTEHHASLAAVPARYRHRHVTHGQVDTRAVQILSDAGLVDLCHLAGTGLQESVPTKLDGREFPAARLDYILATAPLAALTREVHVIRDASTDTASDHYPMIARVDLHFATPSSRSGPGH
jgi:endonuclease/exonuclease/phosphatase family metal-dependent hydrolase